jgi:hypothetical protein
MKCKLCCFTILILAAIWPSFIYFYLRTSVFRLHSIEWKCNWCSGRDLEGSCHDLIQVIFLHFSMGTKGETKSPSQDSQFPGRGSNQITRIQVLDRSRYATIIRGLHVKAMHLQTKKVIAIFLNSLHIPHFIKICRELEIRYTIGVTFILCVYFMTAAKWYYNKAKSLQNNFSLMQTCSCCRLWRPTFSMGSYFNLWCKIFLCSKVNCRGFWDIEVRSSF